MSNDKPLATAKHGGCVQLPTSERERFEAWGRAEGLPLARGKLGGYAFEVTAKAWLAWQYLAAHPTPGGQGDDSDLLEELRDVEDYFEDVDPNPIHLATVRAAIEALAARQPVGDEERAETYRKGWEAGNAAQAVDLGAAIASLRKAEALLAKSNKLNRDVVLGRAIKPFVAGLIGSEGAGK